MATSRTSARSSRVQSLDLFRGLALMVILIDHLELVMGRSVLSRLTLHRVGLCDGLDAFVFISGIVFGIVHRRIQDSSFMRSQWKAIRRAVILLMTNGITFFFVLLLAYAVPADDFAIQLMRIDHALTDSAVSLQGVATTRYQPYGFDILPLYVGMLLIAPSILWLARYTVAGAMGVSIGLYVMVLTGSAGTLTTADAMPWSYQPLGWQLVFSAGMLAPPISVKKQSCSLRMLLATVTLLAFLTMSVFASEIIDFCQDNDLNWLMGRSTPGPLRIVHFGILAAGISVAMPLCHSGFQHKYFDCFKLLGRHPLPVFLFGLWFTYLVVFLVNRATLLELLLIECNGIALSVVVAWVAQRCAAPAATAAISASDK